MNEVAIRLSQVAKTHRLWLGPSGRVKGLGLSALGAIARPFRKSLAKAEQKHHREFFALRELSLEVKRGDSLGILGCNGAGKSTLLGIMAGILPPTSGTVEVNGRVGALLELGSGFNPDFTGRENVYLNSAILGLEKSEVDDRFESIVSFADIGEFIDQPVNTYSSGMMLRLAFAVQTAVDPDILIVDEALAVGDIFFQAKCLSHLKTMLANGLTLVLVTHSPEMVKSLCSRALLLHRGEVLAEGDADTVTEKYFALSVRSAAQPAAPDQPGLCGPEDAEWASFVSDAAEFDRKSSFGRSGNQKARYVRIALLDEAGRELAEVGFGQRCRLRVAMAVTSPIEELFWSVHIRDECQRDLLYTDSTRFDHDLRNLAAGTRLIFDTDFDLFLKEGQYTVYVTSALPLDLDVGRADYYDIIPIACQFYATRPKPFPIYAPVYLHSKTGVRRFGGKR